MRPSLFSALVSGAATVAAVPAAAPLAPALPLSAFQTHEFMGVSFEEAKNTPHQPAPNASEFHSFAAQETCSDPRIRVEWDNMSNSDRQSYLSAIKCLMSHPPSGKYSQATNRYEDLVALHQTFTPNVHGNAKFLIWHRYFLWTFESLLRDECGFSTPLPWFDETKYSGNFRSSSVFSSDWYGAIALGGNCVTDGQFAGLTLHVGPGSGNQDHCLARDGDASDTANTNAGFVNECNSRSDYADMEHCAETGPHAWGHDGIGAVMADVYGSPGDPIFFMHHAFVDHNYRIWQNADSSRTTYVDGTDHFGNPLTLDTPVSVYGIRPNVPISELLNTEGTLLCYRYDY